MAFLLLLGGGEADDPDTLLDIVGPTPQKHTTDEIGQIVISKWRQDLNMAYLLS